MFLKWCLLAVLGVSAGFIISGGIFTILISIGLIPRFAGKTHTSKHVFLYEEMVVFGTLLGNICSVFPISGNLPSWLGEGIAIFYGGFAGIFVGCLAVAIEEMLNSIPIFARRIGFRHGLGIGILAVALGKAAGSLLYFAKQFFLAGGM